MPTLTLRYPSTIGAVAGAKVQAMTLLDLLRTPQRVADAWTHSRDVQTKDVTDQPFIRPSDRPVTDLNAAVMARFRPDLRALHDEASKYSTYLTQLGIPYPTVRTPATGGGAP